MEDKRRVFILTDSEEGYVQSTKAAGIRLSGGEKLESLVKDGKALYWEQKFDEANNTFRRAHDIAHQSQTEGPVTAQIADNISACMLQQRDYHGVLEWTEHALKRDPQNQKALLRRWLALSELGKVEEAGRSLANLEEVPMDDNTRKAINDHKVVLAADEEKQRPSWINVALQYLILKEGYPSLGPKGISSSASSFLAWPRSERYAEGSR